MSKESNFWSWFSANESRYFDLENNDQEALFAVLSEKLETVHPELTFEFGPRKDGKREFIVSACGFRGAFESLSELCDASPSLRFFSVTKFKQRRKPSNLSYRDLRVKASEVFFVLVEDEDPRKIGILLFLPNYDEGSRDFVAIGFLFLDEALGEYDVATKVGVVAFFGYESEYFESASPITELAARFDAEYSARNRNS